MLTIVLFALYVSNDVFFYSLVTRADDVFFSSFVNLVVLGTIFAAEKSLGKEMSSEMPLVSILGSELGWALRDAIAFGGNYNEIYDNNFGVDTFLETDRGRNKINSDGSPQHLAPPGLASRF